MPLQNTAPYHVWHHDDQGSSTSTHTTSLTVWEEKSNSSSKSSNSSGVRKNYNCHRPNSVVLGHQVVETESWDFWQMFHHKRKEPSNLQAGSQCSKPKHLCSSLKACHMAFCCCFQPPSTAFSTGDRVSGKSSWISCKEGKPWVYDFLLFIPTTLLHQFKHNLYIALWLISRQK